MPHKVTMQILSLYVLKCALSFYTRLSTDGTNTDCGARRRGVAGVQAKYEPMSGGAAVRPAHCAEQCGEKALFLDKIELDKIADTQCVAFCCTIMRVFACRWSLIEHCCSCACVCCFVRIVRIHLQFTSSMLRATRVERVRCAGRSYRVTTQCCIQDSTER